LEKSGGMSGDCSLAALSTDACVAHDVNRQKAADPSDGRRHRQALTVDSAVGSGAGSRPLPSHHIQILLIYFRLIFSLTLRGLVRHFLGGIGATGGCHRP
jgi:hypothetical protein